MSTRHRYRFSHCTLALILILVFAALSVPAASPVGAYPFTGSFRALWAQTDADPSAVPVWGPEAYSEELNERYAEAPGGYRLVQYFDKGRMELSGSGPTATVTAGLLASELIEGKIQTGDARSEFETSPTNIAVAGDPDNKWPTYGSLGKLRTLAPLTGGAFIRTYNPNGTFGTRDAAVSDPLAAYATTDSVTGRSIPKAFADFRNDPRHPLATIGLAITEPVWATVKVAGVPTDVLVQAFERRVLTYTPSNPDPYKVEFGNIGQHYYRWRYVSDYKIATPIIAGIAPDFRGAYGSGTNPDLGRPLAPNSAPADNFALVQMQNGYLLYVAGTKKIYALGYQQSAVIGVYDDTWTDGQDPGGKPGPSGSLVEPSRGFGKVWQENPSVKQALGYATGPEVGFPGRMQVFERGFIATSDAGYTPAGPNQVGSGVYGYWLINTATTRLWSRQFSPNRV